MKKIMYAAIAVTALAVPALTFYGINHNEAFADYKSTKYAERMEKRTNKILERLDKNSDTQISLEEFQAKHIERFQKVDVDENGLLSVAELQELVKGMRHGKRKKHDGHHDDDHHETE